MNVERHDSHHFTAIASDPRQNVDFYAGVLAMRLVTCKADEPEGEAAAHFKLPPCPGPRRALVARSLPTVTLPATAAERRA